MVARKKSVRFINDKLTLNQKIFCFTFIDTEDYAASEKWQKIFISISIIVKFTSGSVAQR
jgi:hypothetical protein